MAPQQVMSSARGGLEYSYGADRQMPPPGPSPKSPPTQSMRGAMGGPPPPPPMSRMDEMPAHDEYARAPPPPRRQPYPPQNSHAQYSTQSSDRDLPPRDYRARQPESDEPLRRDVLHYIYEQTSNVHQHSEECTAAIMQCLTQLLNALEIGMHKTEGRVIENMSLNAELQHDLMKSLSKLDTVTRYCSDNEAHLVENLSETKSSARFIQQRFEQDGNKLDSIQTHLMQLTRQVQEAPTYNDMKAHNEETISAISSRFASLNSTLQKLGHDVAEVKAQNVTLMSALTSVSERLSWLERADQDRLRRSSAASTPKAVIPTTAPHIRTPGAAAVSSNEVDLLSSNDMSYGAAVDMPLREQRYEDTVKDTQPNEPAEQLRRAQPVAPVGEHSRPPPPSTIPRGSGLIEAENAEDSPRHSKDEEAPCQVGQEETEVIREATPIPQAAAAIDASPVYEVDDSSEVKKSELLPSSASDLVEMSRQETMDAEYTSPLLSSEYREESAGSSAKPDDGPEGNAVCKSPTAPPGLVPEPQEARLSSEVPEQQQPQWCSGIAEDIELPVASFSTVKDGAPRETADELVKAMTEEGLKAESDDQGVIWNTGARTRALAGGFCDAGLAQLVALASAGSENLRIDIAKLDVEGLRGQPELAHDFARKLLDVYQSSESSTGEAINNLTEWLAEGPLEGVLL
ncbi:hypothetical protein FOZ63_018235 [Perkinsus olseni]|uniref:Uncharacterized protein n=1 Tax=Perkinsus olseni TaxID=32597 RepID=A0A7J6T075_PEROL|nr:hypothetical protein FOZ63_018235 [Perkinsus olseni]